MLKPEQNQLLAETGPDTPMGEVFRRFWMPVLLSSELPERDCPPVKVTVLGEDLVAFRDSENRIAFVDAYCPHRRAPMYFGRNEECGLRCVYHGWKFDVSGQCVDMPSEPEGTPLQGKIRIKSYPGMDRGGVVWIDMSPSGLTPVAPEFEWARVPESHRLVSKRRQRTNWLQALEGGIDSSHVSFLHRVFDPVAAASNSATVSPEQERAYSLKAKIMASDTSPIFTVNHTDYGILIGARRSADDETYYWRLTQCLLPAYTMVPGSLEPGGNLNGHAWVPIDDQTCWAFTVTWNPDRPLTDKERERLESGVSVHSEVDENFDPIRNMENNYLIDREVQKTTSFTGIGGIGDQDMAVQEGMGSLVDRSREHLGTSDTAIIAYRRLMLRLAKALQEGKEPEAAYNGDVYMVRSASVLLPKDVDVQEGAREVLKARV